MDTPGATREAQSPPTLPLGWQSPPAPQPPTLWQPPICFLSTRSFKTADPASRTLSGPSPHAAHPLPLGAGPAGPSPGTPPPPRSSSGLSLGLCALGRWEGALPFCLKASSWGWGGDGHWNYQGDGGELRRTSPPGRARAGDGAGHPGPQSRPRSLGKAVWGRQELGQQVGPLASSPLVGKQGAGRGTSVHSGETGVL